MKKLLKTMAVVMLAATMIPADATEVNGEDDKHPSRIGQQLIDLSGAICSGVAAAFMGKWAVTTMINDHALYAVRAQKADALFQGWLDLLAKGTFKLIDSKYYYRSQQMQVEFGSSLTFSKDDPAVIEKALNQISRIPLVGLIPTDHPFFEAARTAAGNWHITVPVLLIAALIGTASVGYIYERFFKDNNNEKNNSKHPVHEYSS